MKKESTAYFILAILSLVAVAALLWLPPIKQDEAYHNFSDQQTLFNVSNFWNVISNLPFLIVGILGLYAQKKFPRNKIQYIIFFLGVALVSIGSGYYHLNPNSETLIWDRLPMTIAFMALVSIVISEYVNDLAGRRIFIPALSIGILSIVHWVVSEDLRLYGLVQFYPMLAIPVILIFFKSEFNSSKGYWSLLVFYIVAKFFEHFDHQTHHVLGSVSGHTLKHIAAAAGIFIFLYYKLNHTVQESVKN
jgi:hypothetical protein